jgi:hypothetical protein
MEHEHRPIDHTTLLTAYHEAVARHRADPSPQSWQRVEEHGAVLTAALFLPGRFALGRLIATPGALTVLDDAGHIAAEFLLRHKQGDWGDLDSEDLAANDTALRTGSRLVSSYHIQRDQKLWVITEWDRSVTTLLLPEEY